MRTVADKYHVDAIVDSGDITDHGTRPENRYLQEIRHFRAPYLWVRGNHDSVVTERAMRRLENVVVLDGGVHKVKGLTFAGIGDPTFTPDKSQSLSDDALAGYEADAADELAATAKKAGGVDVAVFHDPKPMDALDGLAKVALSGHLHYRKVRHGKDGTWFMTEGSTGGSGLRALEPKVPANIELSVLYLDRTSGDLLAYDDISLGGLGLASAEINRHVVESSSSHSELVAPSPDRSSRGAHDGRPADDPLSP
jgi:predicted phosphodiesterase